MNTAVPVLPFVDEHVTDVAASTDSVWLAITDTIDKAGSGTFATTYAKAVRCTDTEPRGPRPLTEGSRLAGFHVVAAEPGRTLALEGRHHFSTYALTFRIESLGDERSRVRAQTRAAFPGVSGRTYRLLVIRSGGHKIAMGRMLAAIKKRAQR